MPKITKLTSHQKDLLHDLDEQAVMVTWLLDHWIQNRNRLEEAQIACERFAAVAKQFIRSRSITHEPEDTLTVDKEPFM